MVAGLVAAGFIVVVGGALLLAAALVSLRSEPDPPAPLPVPGPISSSPDASDATGEPGQGWSMTFWVNFGDYRDLDRPPPDSGLDFGFQADWDVQIQPYGLMGSVDGGVALSRWQGADSCFALQPTAPRGIAPVLSVSPGSQACVRTDEARAVMVEIQEYTDTQARIHVEAYG